MSGLDFLSYSGFLKANWQGARSPQGQGAVVTINFLWHLRRKVKMGQGRPLLPRNVLSSPMRSISIFQLSLIPPCPGDHPCSPGFLYQPSRSPCFSLCPPFPTGQREGFCSNQEAKSHHGTLLFKALLCHPPPPARPPFTQQSTLSL